MEMNSNEHFWWKSIHVTRTTGEAGFLLGSGNAGGATLYLDGDSNGDWSGGDYARYSTSLKWPIYKFTLQIHLIMVRFTFIHDTILIMVG